MLFTQVVDDDLGCASYLVGDENAGEAVVVDPAFRIEPYLEQAEHHGVRIVAVLETHNHADHLSGHGRFALEHGLPVHIHHAAEPEFPFEPLEDGAEVEDLGFPEALMLWAEARRFFVVVTPDPFAETAGLELCLQALKLYAN